MFATTCAMRRTAERRDVRARVEAKQRHNQRVKARQLDVARFREDLARSKAKADALRARAEVRPAPSYVPPETAGLLGRALVGTECMLGPGELCTSLGPVIAACDKGDGASCLAVGQFLEETPPRSMLTVAFFGYACRFGDPTGCARRDEIKANIEKDVPCADDLVACAQRGLKRDDDALIDEACSLGVADSCALMIGRVDDPLERQVYFEASCQLGNPIACAELGKRLVPDCKDDCFPPAPRQAAAALAIGCAAGWADACK